MKITFDNYKSTTANIDFSKMPETLKQGHEFVGKFGKFYRKDEATTDAIDKHIELLDKELSKTNKANSQATNPSSDKPKNTSKASNKKPQDKPKDCDCEGNKEKSEANKGKAESPKDKPNEEKNASGQKVTTRKKKGKKFRKGQYVQHKTETEVKGKIEDSKTEDGKYLYKIEGNKTFFPESELKKADKPKAADKEVQKGNVSERSTESRLFERIVKRANKSVPRNLIQADFNAFSSAIVEQRVRKTSPFRLEIENTVHFLEELLNRNPEASFLTITLSDETLQKFKAIAKDEIQYFSTYYTGRIYKLAKNPNRKDAQALLTNIEKKVAAKGISSKEPYYNDFIYAKKALENYLENGTNTIVLKASELSGLNEYKKAEQSSLKKKSNDKRWIVT